MKGHRASIKTFNCFVIELLQQISGILRHIIDQVLLERFLIGKRLRLTHGTLGNFHVSAALSHEGTHEGGRIVFQLLLHYRIHGGAHQYRMRRSGIGARGHGGNIGGFKDVKTG